MSAPPSEPGTVGKSAAPGPITGPLSIPEIYRRSLKPADLRFNNYACRPLAAVFVYLLRPTRITPNQITFLSLFVALLCDGFLLGWPGQAGLIAAAVALYLSFVLDCTDGQLARIKGQTSTVGSYLDFLMDEIKAVALIAAVAGRLAIDRQDLALGPLSLRVLLGHEDLFWLGVGLAGVVTAASGIALTTFMRRPEYFEAVTGKKAQRVAGFTALEAVPEAGAAAAKKPAFGMKQLVLLPVRILEWLGKLTLHYPAWFYIPALLGHLEWFLVPYLLAHAMYLGRSGLIVLWRLGR